MKRYYCERNCYHNHQYFIGGKFYTEREVVRGVPFDEEPQLLSDYLIQIEPKLKELDPKRLALLRGALADAESQLDIFTKAGSKQRGAAGLIKKLRETIGQIGPVVSKYKDAVDAA